MDELLDTGRQQHNDYRPATLPNATSVLVLGIISIVGCLFYGIPGLICGIISLSLHKKDKQIYESDRDRYEASFKNSRAGYICAIIGTSLSALYLLILLVALLVGVSAARW